MVAVMKKKAVAKAPATKKTQIGKLKELKLGVLRLEYEYEAARGDIDSKKSFHCKVVYKNVPGLTFETCQNWNNNKQRTYLGLDKKTKYTKQQIKENVHKVVKYLEKEGCNVITGDCGFMMWFQEALRCRHLVKIPIVMSSLMQLPAITGCFGPKHEIVILTANSVTLSPMQDLLLKECGIDKMQSSATKKSLTKAQIRILGCQDVLGFDAVAKGEKVNVKYVTPHMVKHVKNHIAKYPNTRAILMECTELGAYADAVKTATGLPVYDPITACRYLIMGHELHQKFGEDGK